MRAWLLQADSMRGFICLTVSVGPCVHPRWLSLFVFLHPPPRPPHHICKTSSQHSSPRVARARGSSVLPSAVHAPSCSHAEVLLPRTPIGHFCCRVYQRNLGCGASPAGGAGAPSSCALDAGGCGNALSVWLSTLTMTHSFFQRNWNELNCLIKTYLPG